MVKSIDSNSWYPTLVAAGALGLGVGLFAKFNSFKPGGELVGLPHFTLSNRRFAQITAATTLVGLAPKALLTLLPTEKPPVQEAEGIETVLPSIVLEDLQLPDDFAEEGYDTIQEAVVEHYNQSRGQLLQLIEGEQLRGCDLHYLTGQILSLYDLQQKLVAGEDVWGISLNGSVYPHAPNYESAIPFTLEEIGQLTTSMVDAKLARSQPDSVEVVRDEGRPSLFLSYDNGPGALIQGLISVGTLGPDGRVVRPQAGHDCSMRPAIGLRHTDDGFEGMACAVQYKRPRKVKGSSVPSFYETVAGDRNVWRAVKESDLVV